MTKQQMIELLDEYEDDEDISDLLQDLEERHLELIDELEERQHASGFYAFQDLMDMRRREM